MNELSQHLQVIYKATVQQASALVPKIVIAIIVFLLLWIVGIVAKKIIQGLANHSKTKRYLLQLIGQTAKVLIIIIGAIMALGTMGINVTALVASLGLVGFAVGFALKDTLSNLLSGFMVLFYQPFRPGDMISVNKIEGQVTDINLRYTVIKTDHEHTLVPNATILSSPVTVKDM